MQFICIESIFRIMLYHCRTTHFQLYFPIECYRPIENEYIAKCFLNMQWIWSKGLFQLEAKAVRKANYRTEFLFVEMKRMCDIGIVWWNPLRLAHKRSIHFAFNWCQVRRIKMSFGKFSIKINDHFKARKNNKQFHSNAELRTISCEAWRAFELKQTGKHNSNYSGIIRFKHVPLEVSQFIVFSSTDCLM